MKFNMGCGLRKQPGYVNVDATAACEPDELWNLERTPWPWPDGCATEVRFIHSLEHMGADPAVFLAMMRELYRICAPGAQVVIHVPHPRHDNFVSDPTHVRPVMPQTLKMLDLELCRAVAEQGGANTPLALYAGVDFVFENQVTVLDEPFYGQLTRGELSAEEVNRLVRAQNNVAREFQFTLRARKPA